MTYHKPGPFTHELFLSKSEIPDVVVFISEKYDLLPEKTPKKPILLQHDHQKDVLFVSHALLLAPEVDLKGIVPWGDVPNM